jgi:hypothetical protein
MNRTIHILAWGIAGMVLTASLTGAAIVVAGRGIATPMRPFSLTTDRLEQPSRDAAGSHEGKGADRDPGGSGELGEPGDDHVGGGATGSNSGPGSGSGDPGSDEVSEDPEGEHDGDVGDDD